MTHSQKSIFQTFALFVITLVFVACIGRVSDVHAQGQEGQSVEKPNVLLLFVDDLGYRDLSCYGNTEVKTPNIDSLADNGVRFTQAYAHGVCCPSRAQLLTGRDAKRAGIDDWVENYPDDANSGHPVKGLPRSEITLAEVLKKHGYRTGLFGKWHLGAEKGYRPNDQGFEEFFGHLSGGIDAYKHTYVKGKKPHDLYRNGEEVSMDGEYFPDLVTQEVNRFLKQDSQRPFFAYVPFDMVHTPYQPDPDLKEQYENDYWAYVRTLDNRVGRILDTLKKVGERKNTIIVFQSDNGPDPAGKTGKWRGAKASLFEGGIRVPTIMSFPGQIPEGEVRDQMISQMDFFPTILEMSDIPLPDRTIDGKDIGPVLHSDDASSPHDVLHWQWPIWGSDRAQWAVRKGKWKLIVNGNNRLPQDIDEVFLARMTDEKPEYKNYADERPEIVEQLRQLHNEWLDEVSRK